MNEDKITEQANFLSQLTRMIPDIITVNELPGWNIKYINNEALTLIGIDAAQLMRMTIEERLKLMHPDDVPGFLMFRASFTSEIPDNEIYTFQYRVKSAVGEWLTMENRSKIFSRNKDGSIKEVLNIARNITEEQRAEREIKRQAHFLEAICNTNPDMISVVNLETSDLEFTNSKAFIAQGFGTASEQFKSRDKVKRANTVHPDHREATANYFRAFLNMNDDEVQKMEYQATNDKGELDWYLVRSKVFKRNDKGIPTHAINIVHNITELKNAEREIREQTKFISDIAEMIPDTIAVVELPSRNVVYINTAVNTATGYERKEITEMTLEEKNKRIHPDDLAKVNAYYDSYTPEIGDAEVLSMEYRAKTKSGEWITRFLRGKVFHRNTDDSVHSILVVAQNISELKKVEEDLVTLKLEQEKQRLNAIIFGQEQERLRIGEGLHNGVAQLLYAAQSHLQLVQSNGAESDEHLKIAIKILVDAIRDTRKISFELMPPILRDHGLPKALDTLVNRIFSEKIKVKLNVALKKRLPENLEISIYRMIQEGMNNIMKHSDATEVEIEILDLEGTVEINVNDNGIGFSPKKVEKKNVGIGLETIKNRVKLLDGKVQINSKAGKGTSIEISIPVKKE